jgi:hypothetical protein
MSYAPDGQKQVGSSNFGPVHYHNNSGGVQVPIDMMMDQHVDDNNMLIQQISTEKHSVDQNFDVQKFNSSFSSKPTMNSKQRHVSDNQNAKISQSSVISQNTQHKNSLFDESISGIELGHQRQGGSQTRASGRGDRSAQRQGGERTGSNSRPGESVNTSVNAPFMQNMNSSFN